VSFAVSAALKFIVLWLLLVFAFSKTVNVVSFPQVATYSSK
jgi:hypothetical protein